MTEASQTLHYKAEISGNKREVFKQALKTIDLPSVQIT